MPFTAEQFFEVFRRYNESVWPAQIALVAAGVAAALAAYLANARGSWRWARVSFVLMAALWLWSGLAFHKAFLARLTTAGEIFGSLFIAEAGLLMLCASQSESVLGRARPSSLAAGSVLIAFALVAYPAIAASLGQHYPAMPTFGAPCPVAIFTLGVFSLLPAAVPRFAVVIPIVWAAIASYAAIHFGVHEDLVLIVAALVAVVARTSSEPRPRRSEPARTARSPRDRAARAA